MDQCKGFSNWCTSWFDGTWGHCCAIHDVMYTLQYDRIPADLALGSCVARNGPWWMGVLMGLAVLAVGYPAYRKAKFYKLKTDGK